MTSDRVEKLLDDIRLLGEDRYALVQSLRKLILATGPAVGEQVKYGGLLFGAGDPFCGVFSYARHVSIEFGQGASLPDQYKVLEGGGQYRRHIKLVSEKDIAARHVGHYVALAFAQAGK